MKNPVEDDVKNKDFGFFYNKGNISIWWPMEKFFNKWLHKTGKPSQNKVGILT